MSTSHLIEQYLLFILNYLFVYGLCSDKLSASDCMMSNFSEQLIEDIERSDQCLTEVPLHHIAGN
jgi:hypothetical protein